MAFWVYILRCADASYYTGHTDNLEQRIAQHHAGAFPTCYTFKRRPITLVFTQDCATREEALAAEQHIKGWSRKKKEAMMQGNWAEVSRLAQSRTPQPPTPVRPEPVEGLWAASVHGSIIRQAHDSPQSNTLPTPVCPELVEGQGHASAHGSTSSPLTDGEVAR